MLYSSGTTGRPKGVTRPLRDAKVGTDDLLLRVVQGYGFDADTVYLSPRRCITRRRSLLTRRAAPRRHGDHDAAFDAAEALELIQRYRVTHSQWVPTMFVRMLKLPESERRRYDLSGHGGHSCSGTVSGRRQAGDDRLVGADPERILRRNRRQRTDAIRLS